MQSKTQVVNAYNFEDKIFASYQIQIIKNGQILRNFTKDEMMYNPGFFGNLETIAGQNNDNILKNKAFETLIKIS